MADWVYATDHGKFRIKKENFEAAKKALLAYTIEKREDNTEYETLEEALKVWDWEVANNPDGDIVDIYPAESSMRPEEYEALTEGIAEYVEPGSFIVLAFGGTSGCWALAWDNDPDRGKVVGYETNIETVLANDLQAILTIVRFNDIVLFNEMAAKYGYEEPKDDGPERKP